MDRKLENYRGKVFRHFKGGLYLLQDLAIHSETREILVIYKALYGACEVFARPYAMFNEKVPEGKVNPTGQEYRFELVELEPPQRSSQPIPEESR
ncbi:MAG TPA: DUF1653 domain-containing protein [Bacillota bacterium]|nr:DUF1653 domain-containing protein [Bacillota bacterium]